MSHLILVSKAPPTDPEVGESETEGGLDEQRPLLRTEEPGCSTPSSQQEDAKITSNLSLIPDSSLTAQVCGRDR